VKPAAIDRAAVIAGIDLLDALRASQSPNLGGTRPPWRPFARQISTASPRGRCGHASGAHACSPAPLPRIALEGRIAGQERVDQDPRRAESMRKAEWPNQVSFMSLSSMGRPSAARAKLWPSAFEKAQPDLRKVLAAAVEDVPLKESSR
jgi:hypothetical protein